MDSADGRPDLQFDTIASPAASLASASADPLVCAVCRTALESEYFDANGQSVCRRCSETLAEHAATPRSLGVLGRAAAFGVVAAVLGAVLYFAVIAISGFEIGLVAIAIGYMVGYGVRIGTRGRGGRRFQVLAVVLTYWAMGLAYSTLAFKSMLDERAQQKAAAAAPATPGQTAPQAEADGGVTGMGLAIALAFTLILPVMVVVGSLPGGLISAAIVGFGMVQAWRMTAAPRITVSGPYRVGSAAPAAAG